ncbi:hypothetical protein GPA10_28070 [Streptomyces sp. p1417]|uniref:RNA polymerase sigma factor 70 region 4 type 2 domain-containing protein n=1 Tax=Streptomyces typhae TaxID=2681492 RepID=A0A6L6X3T4_9ACTN|nr:sigma-70 family RNA polymerase sigma factor [Streptomyces typhae]MVO88514.1 hypothetical protein [Streptomyces typhae]
MWGRKEARRSEDEGAELHGQEATPGEALEFPRQKRRPSHTPVQPLTAMEQERYDQFYRSEFTSLTRHVIFLGATVEEAKDAAQSSLVDLLMNWRTVRSPRAWCRKAAAHHFMRNDIRINRSLASARRSLTSDEAEAYSLSSPLEDWEFVITFVETHLTGVQRQVIAWHIDGFEPQEIAVQLRMTPATVRSNLRHARKKLASVLVTDHPELAKSMGDAEGKRK